MNMQQLVAQAQKMQRELQKAQDAIRAKEFKVSKGGAVTVIVMGSKELKLVDIDKDALSEENKEMIEEMIVMAVNEACEKIDEEMNAASEAITGRSGGMF